MYLHKKTLVNCRQRWRSMSELPAPVQGTRAENGAERRGWGA